MTYNRNYCVSKTTPSYSYINELSSKEVLLNTINSLSTLATKINFLLSWGNLKLNLPLIKWPPVILTDPPVAFNLTFLVGIFILLVALT